MTPEPKSDGADTVGAYRNKGRGTQSLLPWILAAIAALLGLLLLLWLFGFFGGDDDVRDVDDDDSAVQIEENDAEYGVDDPTGPDMNEGFTPPSEPAE